MAIDLTRTESSLNMARFWGIAVQRNLFGQYVAQRQCGRIGTRGQACEEWFDSETAAGEAVAGFLKAKLNRGYIPVSASPARAVSRGRVSRLLKAFMVFDEIRDVAPDTVAIEPGFVLLDGDSGFEVDAMTHAAAGRRGQVAVQFGHPFQNLFLGLAAIAGLQLANDLVEVFSLNRTVTCADATEHG